MLCGPIWHLMEEVSPYSAFTLVVDVDVIPSAHSAQNVAQFLRTQSTDSYCAYVIATYELKSTAEFPHNKSQLLDLVKYKKAKPFHQSVFKLNQYATNFSL